MGNAKETSYTDLIDLCKKCRESDKYYGKTEFYNYYLEKFKKDLNLTSSDKFLIIIFIASFPLSWFIFQIFSFFYYLVIFIVSIVLLGVSYYFSKRLPLTNSNAKVLMFLILFTQAIGGISYFFYSPYSGLENVVSINILMYFGKIYISSMVALGIYLGYKRIYGAGLTHMNAIMLLTDFANNPNYDDQFLYDFKDLLENLNNWCFEKTGGRIEELNKQIKRGMSEIVLNFESIKTETEKSFDEGFFERITNYNKMENLSKVLQDISQTFNLELTIESDSSVYKITHTWGIIGILTIIVGLIEIISFIISIF